jgi:hypothetical protein
LSALSLVFFGASFFEPASLAAWWKGVVHDQSPPSKVVGLLFTFVACRARIGPRMAGMYKPLFCAPAACLDRLFDLTEQPQASEEGVTTMRALRSMSICLLVSLLAVPAMAETYTGDFWVKLGGSSTDWNVIETSASGGSGYKLPAGGSPWFQYDAPQGTVQYNALEPTITNPVPGWHNQWYYDGLLRPGYKTVTLDFDYMLVNPNPPDQKGGGTDIVLNWSTQAWVDPDPLNPSPPIGNQANTWIGRVLVSQACWLPQGDATVHHFHSTYNLSQYGVNFNPEWVSLDITGYNVWLSPVGAGSIIHTCVPEPGTLVPLVTAGIGLLVFAWRRRK